MSINNIVNSNQYLIYMFVCVWNYNKLKSMCNLCFYWVWLCDENGKVLLDTMCYIIDNVLNSTQLLISASFSTWYAIISSLS